ncbi:MAG: hypothetical protein HYV09_39730 [Deltaproteobacteria bacterium]|nr:hypothetical protein [Deltaproteobacteria bacterium]
MRRASPLSLASLASLVLLTACASGGEADGRPTPSDATSDSGTDGATGTDATGTDATADAPTDWPTDGTDAPGDSPTPDAKPLDPIAESLVGADVPSPRVGMFYLVWHAPPATAMRAIAAKGATTTVEDVLRSGGTKKLADVLQSSGLEGEAMAFHYHVRPKLGFYCIYRARPGETGHVADCPDIEKTLTAHAAQLVAAGVDHVVLDATNLTGIDRAGDLLQLRPTEVLFEEWAKLRAKGIKTPQIAVWHAIPSGSTQWKGYEKLYQDPAYDGLVLRDKKSGKKVFFIVDPPDSGRFPDASIVSALNADGFLVQRMWTIDKTDASIDRWAFMSWCKDGGKITTSVVGAPPCNQPHTIKSALGTAIAVAPSFQTGYASLPFGGAGRLTGLTFRRQWATAFAVKPEWVFISGWNEFTAQPQPNPYGSDPFARSVGLEEDPTGSRLFVDTFGAELGRDIEPTEEYGDAYYELTRSCVRVFKANAKTGAGGCGDPSESCCDTTEQWSNVWTLFHAGVNDTLLTTSRAERDALVAAGGWREVCSRYGTPTVFCMSGGESRTPAGPFLAFSEPAAGRKPLHRCLAGSAHFYSLDPSCEGQKTESVLVYVADKPSSETPRRAKRCYRPATGEHFVALGFACPSGSNDEGTLGWVR